MSLETRFWSKVAKAGENECWIWTASRSKKGYGHFRAICDDGKKTMRRAHRISYALQHKTTLTKDQHILHSCDNPPCVNPAHLSVGTNADNSADKVAKGRQARLKGIKNGSAKLTDDQVREIRKEYAVGNITQQKLAEKYGVNDRSISNIVNNKNWKHITAENCTSQSQC